MTPNPNPSPDLIEKITREIWDAAPISTHAEARDLADTLAALSQTLPAPGEVPEGMKPWTGGDAAPVDWDNGPVVLRNGSTMFPSNVSLAYHANGTNRWNHQRENRNPAWDIIAYTPTLATVAAANDEGVAVKASEALEGIIEHAETRIHDGKELGGWVWRIALLDIVRDARAAIRLLSQGGGKA